MSSTIMHYWRQNVTHAPRRLSQFRTPWTYITPKANTLTSLQGDGTEMVRVRTKFNASELDSFFARLKISL